MDTAGGGVSREVVGFDTYDRRLASTRARDIERTISQHRLRRASQFVRRGWNGRFRHPIPQRIRGQRRYKDHLPVFATRGR